MGYFPVNHIKTGGMTRNTDWSPHYQTFNGYEMALVPVGCFMMGSEGILDDALPINQQCFDRPYWIDRYEVTNRQYGSKVNYYLSDYPVETVTWLEAHNFCLARNARLPTEREWEYAARGPDNLKFPWGDDFTSTKLIEADVHHSAPVGSRIEGNSWVGASDLAGNVSEWVSSLFMPYPYQPDDGRESFVDGTETHVKRGGSYFYGFSYSLSALRQSGGIGGDFATGFRCARDY